MQQCLNNKKFVNEKNTANGEVSSETIFHYKQADRQIEATYSGGSIKSGHLIGTMTSETTFTMFYHHINTMNELRIGQCYTTIFIGSDGKIKLIERWQWLNGDCSQGQSILLEI